VPLLPDKTRRDQTAQMEGQSGGRDPKTSLYLANRQTFASSPDKQTHDLKAGGVAEFG